jgi:regulator of sigma E protease
MALFAQQPQGPIDVKIERREATKSGKPADDSKKPPEVLDVTLQPKAMRELGLAVKAGPIVAVRPDSPAQKAGLAPGDLIVEIDGQPIGDPLSLSQRLTPKSSSDEPVTLTVERRDKQDRPTRRSATVQLELPLQSPLHTAINPFSIESIGVAFQVTLEVAEIAEDGPAAKAGIAPGDVLTEFQFVAENAERAEALEKVMGPQVFKAVELKPGKKSWPEVVHALQMVYPDTKVKLSWTRDGKTISEVLTPRDSEAFFDDSRGVELYVQTQSHVASDWRHAIALGFREAKDQLTQVVTILHRLLTGRLSATNLSGPAGIIAVAGSFASQGLPALLLFLTMLSANLAVLNFLPIPALDGGHMLFLSAEAIRGKPVDERLQVRLTIAGVICLLSLMVFATAMDIHRFSEMFQSWFG